MSRFFTNIKKSGEKKDARLPSFHRRVERGYLNYLFITKCSLLHSSKLLFKIAAVFTLACQTIELSTL